MEWHDGDGWSWAVPFVAFVPLYPSKRKKRIPFPNSVPNRLFQETVEPITLFIAIEMHCCKTFLTRFAFHIWSLSTADNAAYFVIIDNLPYTTSYNQKGRRSSISVRYFL